MKFMNIRVERQKPSLTLHAWRWLGVLVFFCLSISLVLADELGDAKRAYGEGEFADAAALLRPLARDGNAEAQYLLGRMYEQGDGVAKDLDEARKLYERAAQQGHDNAGQKLALFDNTESGDESVVLEWYLPAAEEGDMEAQYNLGFMYETGWGVGIDEAKAANWYKEAAELQHDMAQLRLGMMYVVGAGVAKDTDAGIEWLRQSAENGNRVAEVLVQEVFDSGEIEPVTAEKIIAGIRRVVDEGEQQTLKTLNRNLDKIRAQQRKVRKRPVAKDEAPKPQPRDTISPDVGDRVSDAQFNIAKAMGQGIGIPRNDPEMVKWYITSARQGNADAQFQLGILYMQGRGVTRDVQEGMRWFNAAAAQGHELAKDYLQLWSNELDNATLGGSIAITWLKENARNWDLDSLFLLGQMFEMGRGVNKNLNESKLWYRLAAEGGHKEARRRLDLVEQGKAKAAPKPTTQPVSQQSQEELATGKAVATQFDWFWMILGIAGIGGLGFVIFILFRRGGTKPTGFSVPRSPSNNPFSHASSNVNEDDVEFLKGLWDDKIEPEVPVEAMRAEQEEKQTEPQSTEGATEVFKAVTWGKGGVKKPIISEDDIQLPDIKAMLSGETVRDEREEVESPPQRRAPREVKEVKPIEIAPVEPVKVAARRPERQDVQEPEREARKHETPPMREMPPAPKPDWSHSSDSKVIGADDLAAGSISRDALAASRVNANNLFEDSLSIDLDGKAEIKRNTFPETPKQKKNDGPIDFADLDLQSIKKGGDDSRQVAFPVRSEGSTDSQPEPFEESTTPIQEESPQMGMRLSATAFDVAKQKVNEPAIAKEEPSEEQSLAEVHFNIGIMFANGDGVPRNDAMAYKWFLKSAEEGYAEAQFRLGEMLLSGLGTQKDSAKGLEWIHKAAEGGYIPARDFLHKSNRA